MSSISRAYGTGAVYTSLDYLRRDNFRPNEFEDTTTIKPHLVSANKNSTKIISILSLIILSALIFIAVVAWATVLQTYLDTSIVTSDLLSTAESRLCYASIITIITILAALIYYWVDLANWKLS